MKYAERERLRALGHEVVIFQQDEYRVYFNHRLCRPMWRQVGPAEAYLLALVQGTRQPEYAG